MAIGEDVVVRFRGEAQNLIATIDRVIAQYNLLTQTFEQFGHTQQSEASDVVSQKLKEQARSYEILTQSVERLSLRLQALRQLEAQAGPTGRAVVPGDFPSFRQFRAGASVSSKEIGGAIGLTTQQLEKAAGEAQKIEQSMNAAGERALKIAEQFPDVAARMLQLSNQREFVERRIARLLQGSIQDNIVNRRLAEIQQRSEALIRQAAILREQVTGQLGTRAGGRLSRDFDQRRDEQRRAAERVRDSTAEVLQLEQRIAAVQREGGRNALKLQEQLTAAKQRQRIAVEEEEAARTRLEDARGAPSARLQRATQYTGAAQELARIEEEIARLQALEREALRGNIDAIAPELQPLTAELLKQQTIINDSKTSAEQRAQAEQRRLQILQQIEQLERQAPARGLPEVMSPDQYRRQALANLPGFERTLVQAFDDVGRRFVATLQFAISGALIFGVQQFLREFFQAAVEVERTFADISSALAFDIDAPRSSGEFRTSLEDIRQEVLLLANEFNVLPNDANEAAFKMVARFQDAENAIRAIRGQFLATKISTIDQSEALRALTATAEGFAAATLTGNQELAFQDRLLQRETVAAQGYVQALDEAVQIQQRFGIDVEDTLEGTARAAETFRQLGFTRQQTEATIAAASFQLGQTGVNVAERFNRAFGSITSPDVRDGLLELARNSEDFVLTWEDFASGATAIQAIDAQIRRLESTAPQVANQIRDIIGQRRETEIVAAFFGTSDLRRAIETSLGSASGAAEKRFEVLAETISEKIQSILVQFQELAQNFERLGTLGPLSTFLSAADLAFTAINGLIKLLVEMFNWLERIGDSVGIPNLGDALQNTLVTLLTVLTVMRTISAVAATLDIARAGSIAVQKAAGVPVTALGRNRAVGERAGELTTVFGLLAFQMGNFRNLVKEAGGGLRGLIGVTVGLGRTMKAVALSVFTRIGNLPGLKQLGSAFGLSATAAGGLATALGIAALVVFDFINSVNNAKDANQLLANASRDAENQARQREKTEEFKTEEARTTFTAKAQLENLIAESSGEGQVRNSFATFISSLFPIFDEGLRDQLGGWVYALDQTASSIIPDFLGGGRLAEDLIPKSKEWWEARINEARDAFLRAQIDEINKDIATAGFDENSFRPGGAAFNISRSISALENQLNAPGLTDAQRDRIQTEIDAQRIALEDLTGISAAAVEEYEVTATGYAQDEERLLSRVRSGAISELQAAESLKAIRQGRLDLAARLQAELDEGRQSPDVENIIKNLLNEADGDLIQIQEFFSNVSEFQRGLSEQFLVTDVDQAAFDIAILERELEKQKELLGDDFIFNPRVIELQIQIADAQRRLADNMRQANAELAKANRAIAQSTEQWVQATEDLIEALLIQAGNAFAVGNEAEYQRLFGEAQALQGEIDDRLIDEQQREAIALARLAGPINNKLNALAGQIQGQRIAIESGTLDPVELLEARVELAELLGEQAQAEADAAAALLLYQAGVNDSMAETITNLVILGGQMELTAALFGTETAEYRTMQRQQLQLGQELVDQQLELEALDRALSSDLTDPYVQAQLSLLDTMARLSNPDLGELERKRLEVQAQNERDAAEKQRYDSELFDLRFLFETDQLGTSAYVDALRRLLSQVDTTTKAGKEIFLQIQGIIDGLTGDINDLSFNIPSQIRLPTLFEVRRSLEADQLGVNYQDNREQEINLYVSEQVELAGVLTAIEDAFSLDVRRNAPGNYSLSFGGA